MINIIIIIILSVILLLLLIMIMIIGKGQMGSALMGVTANFMFFDRGTFWVLPLTCFYIHKSARVYLFPQSVKIDYFCSGPISVDPICPQPSLFVGIREFREPGFRPFVCTTFVGRIAEICLGLLNNDTLNKCIKIYKESQY